MMQSRTDRATTPAARRGTWTLVTIVILGAAILATGAWSARPDPGDEPPIRVVNGSMNITIGAGSWSDGGNAWVPSDGGNPGQYDVKIQCGAGANCANGSKASGNVVKITYSDGFVATVTPSGGHTGVTPKAQLTKVSNAMLRYGQTGVGFIKSVQVLGGGQPLTCTFASAGALTAITICPAGGSACQ